jgi:hypothetical protein
MYAQLPPYNNIPAVEVLAPLSRTLPPSLPTTPFFFLLFLSRDPTQIDFRNVGRRRRRTSPGGHRHTANGEHFFSFSSSCSLFLFFLVSLFFLFFVFCLVGVCRGASSSTIPAQERPTTPKQHNPTTKSLQQQQPKICFSQKTTENLQPNLFQETKKKSQKQTHNQKSVLENTANTQQQNLFLLKNTNTHTHTRTKICFSQKTHTHTHTQMSPIKTTTQNLVPSESKENQPTLSQKSHTKPKSVSQKKHMTTNKISAKQTNNRKKTLFSLSLFLTHKNHNKIIFF